MNTITVYAHSASTPREAIEYARRHVPAVAAKNLTVRRSLSDNSTFEVTA